MNYDLDALEQFLSMNLDEEKNDGDPSTKQE
jgi:hypothetical protein